MEAHETPVEAHETPEERMTTLHTILPGLGEPTPVRIEPGSPAAGRTLAELNLRGMTGATVLAIRRDEDKVVVPQAHEPLRTGDVLALAGTHEAIDMARRVIQGGGAPEQPVAPTG